VRNLDRSGTARATGGNPTPNAQCPTSKAQYAAIDSRTSGRSSPRSLDVGRWPLDVESLNESPPHHSIARHSRASLRLCISRIAHTPFGKGYPAHFPVQGTKECGDFFARLTREIHARGVRVVGHFNMTFILGDPEKKAGFFEWYDKGWDEAAFGPKPCANPTD